MTEPRSTTAKRARAMVSAVSRAGGRMATNPDQIPEIALDGVLGIGLDAAAFRALDHESIAHRLLGSRGLEEDRGDEASMSSAMTDLVLQRGETVVARRANGQEEVPLPEAARGFDAVVACPIWVEGWVVAVLIGAARPGTAMSQEEVESIALLASQAGLTLNNVQLLQEEAQIVGRLEQGDRLKDEFLATISHELRTPLTVLMGNGISLEQGWDGLDDDARLALLAGMNSAVRILDEMLTNLLDYSRLRAGELWASFEPFDISRLLRRTCEHAIPKLAQRQIDADIEDDLLASGDVVLIRRVLSTLLDNAATHTPPSATITVSCRRRDREVILRIADDGPGIADLDLPFLGEHFFRGGEANTRPKGLGLGLALAGGILDLHDTSLSIRNTAEGGADFSFSLPWVADPARIDEGGAATNPSPSADGRS